MGQKNVINEPLVNRDRIIFQLLHIKLGLMQSFVKVLHEKVLCFKHICKMFSVLSIDKLSGRIIDGVAFDEALPFR